MGCPALSAAADLFFRDRISGRGYLLPGKKVMRVYREVGHEKYENNKRGNYSDIS